MSPDLDRLVDPAGGDQRLTAAEGETGAEACVGGVEGEGRLLAPLTREGEDMDHPGGELGQREIFGRGADQQEIAIERQGLTEPAVGGLGDAAARALEALLEPPARATIRIDIDDAAAPHRRRGAEDQGVAGQQGGSVGLLDAPVVGLKERLQLPGRVAAATVEEHPPVTRR